MNEKQILNDTLSTLKAMSVNMTFALNEASCDNIYNLYYEQFKDINRYTKQVYDLMYQKGYYSLCNVEKNKISKVLKTIKDELN